jgi:hypothetical protein
MFDENSKEVSSFAIRGRIREILEGRNLNEIEKLFLLKSLINF